jgi:hypothetical protein
LLFLRGAKVVALLPANIEAKVLHSHGGLSYGGLVVDQNVRLDLVLAIFEALLDHCRARGIETLIYKPVPHIYHAVPTEEDLYALFRHQARLYRRDAATAIPPQGAKAAPTRVRTIKKAAAAPGVTVEDSHHWPGFWEILEQRLEEKFDLSPTHSLDEITLLAARFPEQIRLIVGKIDSRIHAGTVLYRSRCVDHVQYMATDETARRTGLLDLVMDRAVRDAGATGRWLSFGISTEDGGRTLNSGLNAYKERFGARCIVQDFYRLDV